MVEKMLGGGVILLQSICHQPSCTTRQSGGFIKCVCLMVVDSLPAISTVTGSYWLLIFHVDDLWTVSLAGVRRPCVGEEESSTNWSTPVNMNDARLLCWSDLVAAPLCWRLRWSHDRILCLYDAMVLLLSRASWATLTERLSPHSCLAEVVRKAWNRLLSSS